MINNYAINSYKKTDVITSDPGRLILLCYEGAIDNLKKGKEHYQRREFEEKDRAFSKAQGFIDELLCALDFEKGGAIARNLSSLYRYMLKRIISGDINRDLSAIDEVIGILEELKTAWEEVVNNQKKRVSQEHVFGGEQQFATVSGSI